MADILQFKDPSNDYDNDYDGMELDEKFDKINDYLSGVLGYNADSITEEVLKAVSNFQRDHYHQKKIDEYDFDMFTEVKDVLEGAFANLQGENGSQLGKVEDLDEVADNIIDIINTEDPDEDYAWDLY